MFFFNFFSVCPQCFPNQFLKVKYTLFIKYNEVWKVHCTSYYRSMSLGYGDFGSKSWCSNFVFSFHSHCGLNCLSSTESLLYICINMFNLMCNIEKDDSFSFHSSWLLFVFSLVASLLCLPPPLLAGHEAQQNCLGLCCSPSFLYLSCNKFA